MSAASSQSAVRPTVGDPVWQRPPDGAPTVALVPERPEDPHEYRATRGQFGPRNQFATREYRARLKRDPHYYVQRSVRDTIGKLRAGKMAPGVALALVALLKLQLELIDRTQTTATIEGLQNEVGVLSAQLRDLLAEQADLGAR